MKKGLVLLELIVAIVIICMLALLSSRFLSSALQISMGARAKTQIASISEVLEMIKDDTGYYPASLSDIAQSAPPDGMEKGWQGPYVNSIPLDPWKTEYFYNVGSSNIFTSPYLVRGQAHPQTFALHFDATGGAGTMHIENHGVASAEVWLNGEMIFRNNDFSHHPNPGIYEKDVSLQNGDNEITVWIASGPGREFTISIYGSFPTSEGFILGSYGKDKTEGGKGFNEDITWYSNKYPNLR